MKKVLLNALALFLPLVHNAQHASTQKMDSLIITDIDTLGQSFKSHKFAYAYDAEGHVTSEAQLSRNHSTLTWALHSNNAYTYDVNGNPTTHTHVAWNAATNRMILQYKVVTHYTAQQDLLEKTYQVWNDATNMWKPLTKNEYTYDSNHRPVNMSAFVWDTITTLWRQHARVSHVYADTLHTIYSLNSVDGNTWETYNKEEVVLNASGHEISSTSYRNVSSGVNVSVWEPVSKMIYGYDAAGKKIQDAHYNYHKLTHTWTPTVKTLSSFDQDHNLTVKETQTWIESQNTYVLNGRIETQFDPSAQVQYTDMPDTFLLAIGRKNCHHIPVTQIDYVKLKNQLMPHMKVDYHYSGSVATGLDGGFEATQHEVYPNPCNEVLHVSDDARIFDMAGHLMTQGRSSIDMSALDAGIYMVKTSSGMVKVMKE